MGNRMEFSRDLWSLVSEEAQETTFVSRSLCDQLAKELGLEEVLAKKGSRDHRVWSCEYKKNLVLVVEYKHWGFRDMSRRVTMAARPSEEELTSLKNLVDLLK